MKQKKIDQRGINVKPIFKRASLLWPAKPCIPAGRTRQAGFQLQPIFLAIQMAFDYICIIF
jgi:hypothetical protein